MNIAPSRPTSSPGRSLLRTLLRDLYAMTGLVMLAVLVALALSASWLYPDDPLRTVGDTLIAPGQDWRYPLGTDTLGRDLAAGLVHGARVSLGIGLLATLASTATGLLIGALAGYVGGWVDDVLNRLVEVFQTTPSLILSIVIVSLWGPSIGVIVFAISLGAFPTTARLIRAECRRLRELEFVQACRTQGYSHARILLGEMLPNALAPIIVISSLMAASAILAESGLAFLGLGDPNTLSWGSMIGNGREMLQSAWYIAALPGAMISLTILALNLIGDGLNRALNPRASN